MIRNPVVISVTSKSPKRGFTRACIKKTKFPYSNLSQLPMRGAVHRSLYNPHAQILHTRKGASSPLALGASRAHVCFGCGEFLKGTKLALEGRHRSGDRRLLLLGRALPLHRRRTLRNRQARRMITSAGLGGGCGVPSFLFLLFSLKKLACIQEP